MKINKLLFKAGFVLSLLFAFAFSVSAANNVENIRIDVTLNKDGSALIEQEWRGTFFEGTECYYEFICDEFLEIEDFKVSMGNREYKTLGSWDVTASFSEKAYKCGLNYIGRDTYEVCWGISDYGGNTYKLSYTVKNMLLGYDDSDGFNFRFINPGMNTGPTDARITFRMADGTPITDENCNIWGFGYDGDIVFYNGFVEGNTLYPLSYSNHMTIMMQFEKGLFDPTSFISEDFETEVKEPAFDGSYYDDYEEGFDIFAVITVLMIVLVFGCVAVGLTWAIVQKVKKNKIEKNAQYVRDVPKEDINVAYSLLNALHDCEEGDIISARILRLIAKGIITPVDSEDKGFLSGKKVSFRINTVDENEIEHWDKKIYAILKASAGGDGILEPLEMKLYCRDHPSILRAFLSRCKLSGEERLDELKCSKKGRYNAVTYLSEEGIKMLSDLYGLKKYLKEFSLIDERTVNDTYIWQEYLIYATLFGIADEVADQLVKVYPQLEPQVTVYRRDIYFARTCRHYMYSNMMKTEHASRTSASYGSGGRVSIGGGGGFRGGGFGGGTR
ncbi:MAG: DUF2207 domain-containing protein [Clostridia bacterium]|nr:DUF2207 domain-containing protein [Clostridia bacterium]